MERGREAMLLEQLEESVAELEGSEIDSEALARMTPGDAEIVRAVLDDQNPGDGITEEESVEEDWLAGDSDPEAEREELVAEIARLEEEIALSRRRQHAYERYLDALGG